MKRLLLSLVGVLIVVLGFGGIALAQPKPEYKLGFKALADQIPNVVGQPSEEEHYGLNGDSLQQTTTGLMVWRKADNWTAFTNGSRTWINGPAGVQERSNDDRFEWEVDPNPTTLPIPVTPTPVAIATPKPIPVGVPTWWPEAVPFGQPRVLDVDLNKKAEIIVVQAVRNAESILRNVDPFIYDGLYRVGPTEEQILVKVRVRYLDGPVASDYFMYGYGQEFYQQNGHMGKTIPTHGPSPLLSTGPWLKRGESTEGWIAATIDRGASVVMLWEPFVTGGSRTAFSLEGDGSPPQVPPPAITGTTVPVPPTMVPLRTVVPDYRRSTSVSSPTAAPWNSPTSWPTLTPRPTWTPFSTPPPLPTTTHPEGATARCRDGTYSYSQTRSGTCSYHGGVAEWY